MATGALPGSKPTTPTTANPRQAGTVVKNRGPSYTWFEEITGQAAAKRRAAYERDEIAKAQAIEEARRASSVSRHAALTQDYKNQIGALKSPTLRQGAPQQAVIDRYYQQMAPGIDRAYSGGSTAGAANAAARGLGTSGINAANQLAVASAWGLNTGQAKLMATEQATTDDRRAALDAYHSERDQYDDTRRKIAESMGLDFNDFDFGRETDAERGAASREMMDITGRGLDRSSERAQWVRDLGVNVGGMFGGAAAGGIAGLPTGRAAAPYEPPRGIRAPRMQDDDTWYDPEYGFRNWTGGRRR